MCLPISPRLSSIGPSGAPSLGLQCLDLGLRADVAFAHRSAASSPSHPPSNSLYPLSSLPKPPPTHHSRSHVPYYSSIYLTPTLSLTTSVPTCFYPPQPTMRRIVSLFYRNLRCTVLLKTEMGIKPAMIMELYVTVVESMLRMSSGL